MDVEYEDEAVRRNGRDAYLTGASSMYAYSPQGEYFVHVSLAVYKHRLRVYNTSTGKSVAEHSIESGRVTAMSWQAVDAELAVEGEQAAARKRRKTSRASEVSSSMVQVVALGLSTGSFLFFSPSRDEVVYTSPPSATLSPILAMTTSSSEDDAGATSLLWTSSSDGTIKAYNLRKNAAVGSWQDPDRTAYTCISVRPGPSEKEGDIQILAGHHTVRLLSLSVRSSSLSTEARKPKIIASLTGHVSPITYLLWDSSNSAFPTPPVRFVSAAESDRIAQIWEVPITAAKTKAAPGRMIGTIPLDSDVVHLAFSSSSTSLSPSPSSSQTLLALSSSGIVSLHQMNQITSKRTSSALPILDPRTIISVAETSTGAASDAPIVAAHFVHAMPGHVSVARITSLRPVFETVVRFFINTACDTVRTDIPDHLTSATLTTPTTSYPVWKSSSPSRVDMHLSTA